MGSYADYRKRKKAALQSGQDTTRQEKTAYQKYRERKNASAGGSVSNADTSYQKYMTDYQSFASAAVTDSKNVNFGNALTNLESRNGTAKDLRDRASKLALYFHANKDSLDSKAYETAISNIESTEREIDRIMKSFENSVRYYNQWDTEDDYNAFVAGQEEYQKKLGADTTALEQELDELKAVQTEYNELKRKVQTLAPSQSAAETQRMGQIYQQYGDLDALISKKQAYLTDASRLQEGVRLAGVADSESEYYDPEFSSKTGYVSTEANGWGKLSSQYGMGYDDLVYEYINGGQNGMRDKIIKKGIAYNADNSLDTTKKWQIYDHMTEDEISIYNYYYATGGKEAADKYLDGIQETLNYRSAQARYGELEGNTGLELLFGVEAGLDQFESGVKNLFNDDNYIAPSDTQILSGMVREDLKDTGPQLPEWLGGVALGQAGYDAITTTANMVPSILVSTAIGTVSKSAGAYVGNALMGASAAGSAYQEKLNQGYTKEQAGAYGLMIGASEVVLEKVLGGISKLGGGNLTKVATQNLSKVDNVLARFAMSAGGKVLMNAGSEAVEEGLQSVIEPYLWQAVSGEEASVEWEEALYSALMGFVTGGVFEGGNVAVDAAQTQAQYRQMGEQVKANGGLDALRQLASEMADVAEGDLQKQLNEQAGKVTGDKVKTHDVGKLYSMVQSAATPETVARLETAASQQTNPKAAIATVEDTFTDDEKTAPEGGYGVSEDGKTYLKSTGDAVNIMGVASVKNGKMTLKLEDGRVVNASDVEYGSADEAVVYEMVANMGVNALAANMLIENYTPGGDVSATVYAKGIEEAYMAGKLSIPAQELATMPFASELAEYQRQAAYQLGELFGGKQTAKEQATVRKNRNAEGADTSKGKVHFNGDRNSLNKTQKASMDAMEVLAKTLGAQIYVFESEVGSDGKRKGVNGWYDPSDGSIHIDLYAGADGKGTMLFTVAHELTHFIRQWSPAKFKVLANFLLKQYSEKGVSVQELVDNQIAKAKRSGRDISYDTAYEEVIADSMEAMLTDGNVVRMMAELRQQDKTLWEKICDWFKDLAGKLKAVVDAYKGVQPDSAEGRLVADMQDVIGTLQALYMDALVDASENFDAGVQKITTPESGGVRYMGRDQNGNVVVDEEVDAQNVRKTLTDIYNGNYKSDNNYFPVLKNTPEVYKHYCHLDADRSFVMAKKKAYKAMQQKNKNQHALGVDGLMYVIENLGTPDYIVYQNVGEYAGNYAAIIISEQKEIFAAVQLGEYKDAQYAPNGEKGYYNTLITAFYPNEGYIDDKILIPENDVVYDKNEDPLQVASGVTPSDRAEGSSNGSIRNPDGIVNKKLSDRASDGSQLSERQQEYFKDSKERDSQGRLRVMYRGDKTDVTVFDRKKSSYSNLYGRGFYFTNSDSHAGQYGKARAYFLNVVNPVSTTDCTITKEQMQKFLEAVAENEDDYSFENYGYGATVESVLEGLYTGKSDFAMMYDVSQTAIGDMVAAAELFNEINGTAFDGFILDTETVIFNSNQAKRADNLNPSSNHDTRFSDRDPDFQKVNKVLQQENEKLKEDVSYLKELVKIQRQVTGGKKFTKSSVEAAAQYLKQNANAKGDTKELAGLLTDLYEHIASTKELTWEDVKEQAQPAVEWLQGHVDKTSQADALENAQNRELITQDLLRQVYDSYWRVSTLYTVADVKQREINRLKGEHYQRMTKLREYHAEKTAQLKQEHKERLEKVRQDYRDRADAKVKKITEKYQESRQKGIEGRRKTEMRHKIQKVVKKLNDLLLKESKEHHVPDNLRKAVAEALDAVNMDTVGADERIAKYDELIAKATDPDVIASLTETRDRIAKAGERLADRISKLKAAYDSIKTGADSASISVYDEVIANKIQEAVELVGNTALRDMSYEQLEAVYEMYTMVAKSISNANKSFKEARGATITQMGTSAIREVKAAGGSNQYAMKALEGAKKFGWDLLKPYYAFSLIGSDTLSKLYDNVRKGEDVWAVDVEGARRFFRQQAEKHGYDDWDLSEEHTFTDVSGREFKVSLQQIMSLYAYSKRAQADKHLEKGGFVFDSAVEVVQKKGGIPVKYRVNTANAYNLNRLQINEIVDTLSDDQIAFVDAMQDYLSTVMGEKGNEVSLALYDVRLFKEKNYFPLKSASQYTFQQTENTGDVKLKNSGFSKKTVVNASNPIILSDFMNVWGSHVNDMSMYHAFVLPLEDFNRVYNYKTLTSEETSTQSVKAALQNAYGVASTKYIKQMLEDINGGARADDRASIMSRWMGKFKKGSVFANASVVIQQPSAIARATALIEPQYFIGAKISQKRHKLLWEEVKQYAPVAIIKEMGYFDTNMGLSTVEYITAKDYDTIGEKAKAMFADGNYRDEVLSRPAALADELSWCYIWEAVKREIRGKNPGLDVGSEVFLKKAGERFTEVVARTQVYDSVLSRSGLMRSKDTGVKMMTAFMSEPTTSMNMVFDALVQGKRGNRGYTRNAIGAVIASQILNSLLVSIVYAARDDDEDKTYLEKYIANFTAKTLDGLSPLSYLPFIKDIVSITRGYTVERSDMSVISDIWAAWQKLPNENVSVYRKIEDFGGSIAQAFGLPVKNIMRDVRSIWQTAKSFISGPETTGMGIGAAIREEVTGDSIPKYKQLYDAMVKGDTGHQKRIAATYKDEAALEIAVRKGLREFDARISEAAEARYYGDFAEYERIFNEIEGEGNFGHSQIAGAIQAEIDDMDETDSTSSTPKKYGMYSIEDFMLAVCVDDSNTMEIIRAEILQTAQENGKSKEQAQDGFVSSAVSACKEQYLSGKISEKQTIGVLLKYCDRSEREAQADISYWTYKQDNPDTDVSAQWFDTYYEKVESSGIDVDTYVGYRNQKSAYTKKADILKVINALPITKKQKDALYYAEGWAESTLDEAPWH